MSAVTEEVSSADGAACSGSEAFALQVLGTSMEPEFNEGDIVLIEPQGVMREGSFVLAQVDGEWIFRQLAQRGDAWLLRALNPVFADIALANLSGVRGVIIQKSVPGKRRLSKRYV